jgi:hypothetical protein
MREFLAFVDAERDGLAERRLAHRPRLESDTPAGLDVAR